VVGQGAQCEQRDQPEADPRHAEQGAADCDGRGLPCLREAPEQEREAHCGEQAPDDPDGTALLRGHERQDEPEVAGDHDRAERPGHRVELVQRYQADDEREHAQPPAAEPHDAEHER
jgi:hypothetical protein